MAGKDSARYAAYDHTLARYLTGAVSRTAARAAAKAAPAGHRVTIRKVD